MKPLGYAPADLKRPDWQIPQYWNDAAYRARVDAEVAHNRAICNAALDASLEGSPHGIAQQERWAREVAA